jgi:hypothetical protein
MIHVVSLEHHTSAPTTKVLFEECGVGYVHSDILLLVGLDIFLDLGRVHVAGGDVEQ